MWEMGIPTIFRQMRPQKNWPSRSVLKRCDKCNHGECDALKPKHVNEDEGGEIQSCHSVTLQHYRSEMRERQKERSWWASVEKRKERSGWLHRGMVMEGSKSGRQGRKEMLVLRLCSAMCIWFSRSCKNIKYKKKKISDALRPKLFSYLHS